VERSNNRAGKGQNAWFLEVCQGKQMHDYLSLPGNLAGAVWDVKEIAPIKFL